LYVHKTWHSAPIQWRLKYRGFSGWKYPTDKQEYKSTEHTDSLSWPHSEANKESSALDIFSRGNFREGCVKLVTIKGIQFYVAFTNTDCNNIFSKVSFPE